MHYFIFNKSIKYYIILTDKEKLQKAKSGFIGNTTKAKQFLMTFR